MSHPGLTGLLSESVSAKEAREEFARLYKGLLQILHEQNPKVKDDLVRTLLEGRSV